MPSYISDGNATCPEDENKIDISILL